MHRADYDYTVIYRVKQGGGSTFRHLSPPGASAPGPIILPQVGPGCQLPVDAAALGVIRWATRGPPALAANHHGGRAPYQLPDTLRPRRGGGAARRARLEPAPGALLAHHPGSPAGVVGRIGGPPPGGAAPPPHLILARMGAQRQWGADYTKYLFCTPSRAMYRRAALPRAAPRGPSGEQPDRPW